MDLHTVLSALCVGVTAALCAVFPASAALITPMMGAVQVVLTRFAKKSPPPVAK